MPAESTDFDGDSEEWSTTIRQCKSTGNLECRERKFETKSASLLSFIDTLELYRSNAKKSHDPAAQLSFVKYLIEISEKSELQTDEEARSKKKALQKEAATWLRRLSVASASMGKQPYAEAQHFLADCHRQGTIGLELDQDKAFALYIQASKQNHPKATYKCANCYELGTGTKKDYSRAVQFYRKAASLGEPLAMHKLAMILLYGQLGQTKNAKEGITWLKRAAAFANEENPQPLYDLAVCFEKNSCSAVIPDEPYALELFKRASSYNHPPSLDKLGYCYEFGKLGCPIDPVMSVMYYTKAADYGDSDAELALSGWYLSGADTLIPQNDSEAYNWAKKAAEKQNPKAEFAIGHYLEKGIGVEADLEEAKIWYTRAASQGNKKAAERLALIKKFLKKKKKNDDRGSQSISEYFREMQAAESGSSSRSQDGEIASSKGSKGDCLLS